MANFFSATKQADLKLLHSSVRDHPELDNLAEKVEWEIIDFYRQRQGGELGTTASFFATESGQDPTAEVKVWLVGYDAETPSSSEAGLKEALRRTIAYVTEKILRSYDASEGGVKSIRQGARAITYGDVSPQWDRWPDGWKRYLVNYDAREGLFSI